MWGQTMLDEQETTWDRRMREHEASLVKSQRVRVMPGEGCHHHGEQEAGITGVIVAANVPVPGDPKDHQYLVLFDRPLRTSIWASCYAAAELTPIPWPTPEEVVADTLRVLRAADPGEGE